MSPPSWTRLRRDLQALHGLLALNAAGALTKTHTIQLISAEEAVRAMQKAHDTKTGYTPPG
jgi:hypothetical protein